MGAHLLAHTLCRERHCITNLIATMGQEQEDWTEHFRLYASKLQAQALFTPIIKGVVSLLGKDAPIVLAIDDSLLPKTGRKIRQSGFYRDPLGPPFHTNLIRALKFVQISIALPDPLDDKRARMIPIAFRIIPKLQKPSKDASKEQLEEYQRLKEHNTVAWHWASLMQELRELIDAQIPDGRQRLIRLCGDGHYSVAGLLQNLPHDTVYLGRTRGDIHICKPAAFGQAKGKGRKPSYGDKLPTPEELRKDAQRPWEQIAIKRPEGQTRIRYKVIKEAKWHKAGEKQWLQVVVVAPLRYKKTKKGPWLYTKPAYLICSDPSISVQELIETYLWRWDIEVNFKEQKQLFGLAQAQVRHARSVQNAPAVAVAAYAGLHLAYARLSRGSKIPLSFKPPKWDRRKPNQRLSTAKLLKQIQSEFNTRIFPAIHFSDFALN